MVYHMMPQSPLYMSIYSQFMPKDRNCDLMVGTGDANATYERYSGQKG